MISALVFSNNTSLTNYLQGICTMSGEISIVKTLDTVRTGYPIARQLSAWARIRFQPDAENFALVAAPPGGVGGRCGLRRFDRCHTIIRPR